jgi:hypothetical protein
LSRLYFGRFAVVHIGGPSSNQAASLESQQIQQIQLLFGRTLRLAWRNWRTADLPWPLSSSTGRERFYLILNCFRATD